MASKKTSSKGPQEQLTEAVRAKNLDQVRSLLAAGADPNGLSKDSTWSPLKIAVYPGGDDSVAALLIGAGANPNETDEFGFTLLHYASHLGKTLTCEALLGAGVDPNALSTARSPSLEGMTKAATALKVADNAAIRKLLSGVTTVGLPTGGFEKKLQSLRGWASHGADFEGGEPELDTLAGFDAEGFLAPIGQTGNGSIFALWSAKKAKQTKDGPVVYLDSEGEPCCAVAGSLDEFLSLLPYGSGWIHEAASGTAPEPKTALAEVAAAEADAEDAEGKPALGGKPFANWWKDTFGVAPAKDPNAIISAAMAKTPSFDTWLRKRTLR